MLQILTVTGPIYLIIAAGYLAVRYGLFTKAEMRVFGRFVIQFCLPALLFDALSRRRLAEVLNGPYLFAYALGSLAVLLAGYFYARRVRGAPMSLAGLQGLGMSASNTGYVGYPILVQLIGAPAGVALALSMMVENLLVLPLALALADAQGGDGWRRALRASLHGLLRNPLIYAIVAGFLFALFEWRLPDVLGRTVQIVATASSPVALFVIGGTLVGLQVGGVRGDLARVTAGKLLLHPLAVGFLLWLLPPADPTLRTAALVLASMPMIGIYPVLAQKYHHEGFCAATLLVATVASFFTISLVLWGLHALPGAGQ